MRYITMSVTEYNALIKADIERQFPGSEVIIDYRDPNHSNPYQRQWVGTIDGLEFLGEFNPDYDGDEPTIEIDGPDLPDSFEVKLDVIDTRFRTLF